MTRPSSVVLFERLFLLSTLLGLINTVLLVPRIVAPTAAALGSGAAVGVAIVGGLIGAGLLMLLWYFAARRGANVARWLLVALGAYTLYSLINILVRGANVGGLLFASVLAAGVLQLVAIAMLFRADARPWFAKRQGGPAL